MSARHAYFFKAARYVRYNIDTEAVDVGPTEISRFWTALPAEFQAGLDAVVNWGDGHAYFFKGARYVRYNIDTEAVDVGPTEISRFWTALPAEFQAGLDAVVNWGDGHAYFFKGARYVRYNIDTEAVDVGPTEVSRFWTALPAEFQAGLDAVVNWGDGHAYFFKGARYVRYNIDTEAVDVGPTEISRFWTALPAEFQSALGPVFNWSQREHWERRSLDERLLYVMERLVEHYEYPVNGAAGLCGNLVAESGVIPTRIEDSDSNTPMRSKNFQGQVVDHTPDDVMRRSVSARVGPQAPGIGLAQWTSEPRRSGLFAHPFEGSALGARVVFNMDAQVDYLVHELQNAFAGVQAVLVNPAVTTNNACDEVLYNFEVPGSILSGGSKLPRSDGQVQQVFAQRRPLAQRASNAYRAVHP